MLDKFIILAEAAGKLGNVTAASLYPSGLIYIDVVSAEGEFFQLTYGNVQPVERNNDAP